MFFCAFFWGSICLNASAAWQPVTEYTYAAATETATINRMTITYNRQPGIYFHPFTLSISATIHSKVDSGPWIGVWKVPYSVAATSDNSTRILDMNNSSSGTTRYTTYSINSWECFTSSSGKMGDKTPTVNANHKYWYRIYPYDGSVTTSAASGSVLSNGGTVTFTTPQCYWPTYYGGNSTGYNSVVPGVMWPDVLISYSTQSMADVPAPTYQSHSVRGTYNSGSQNTSASLNIPQDGNIYFVKVRLGVHAGGDDYDYADKINQYVFFTRSPVTASPVAGTYRHTQEVSLTGNENCELYYTTDGSTPTRDNGVKYTAPIRIEKDTTLRAQAYRDGVALGNASEFRYVITLPEVKANPSSGTVMAGSEVTLSLTGSDATHTDIIYTTDASLPPEQWAVYTAPIKIASSGKLYAAARDKVSGRCGETATFTYQCSTDGYMLNDLAFWDGDTKIAPTGDLSAFAGKTLRAKANITKIQPAIQGWLVTALYPPSGRAQIRLDKLDQVTGIATGDVTGRGIALPADTTNCVLKTFVVHDFLQLRPVSAVVQLGKKQ